MRLNNLHAFSKSQMLHIQQPLKREQTTQNGSNGLSLADLKIEEKKQKLQNLQNTLQETSKAIKNASTLKPVSLNSPRSPMQNKHTFNWMKKRYVKNVDPKYLGSEDDVRQSLFLKSIYECIVSISDSSILKVADLYLLMKKYNLPINVPTFQRIIKVIDSDENGFMEQHQFKDLMFSEEANDIYVKYLNSPQYLEQLEREKQKKNLNNLYFQLQKGPFNNNSSVNFNGVSPDTPLSRDKLSVRNFNNNFVGTPMAKAEISNFNGYSGNSPTARDKPMKGRVNFDFGWNGNDLPSGTASPVSIENLTHKCLRTPLEYYPKSLGALVIYVAFLINREKIFELLLDKECEVAMQVFGLTELFNLVQFQAGQQVNTESKKRIMRQFGIGGSESIVDYLRVSEEKKNQQFLGKEHQSEKLLKREKTGLFSPRSFNSEALTDCEAPLQNSQIPLIYQISDIQVKSQNKKFKQDYNDDSNGERGRTGSRNEDIISDNNEKDQICEDEGMTTPTKNFDRGGIQNTNFENVVETTPKNVKFKQISIMGKSLVSKSSSSVLKPSQLKSASNVNVTNESTDEYMASEFLSDSKKNQLMLKKINLIIDQSQKKGTLEASKIFGETLKSEQKIGSISYVTLPFMKRKLNPSSSDFINLSPDYNFSEFNKNATSIIGHNSISSGVASPRYLDSKNKFLSGTSKTLQHIDLVMSFNLERLKSTQRHLVINKLLEGSKDQQDQLLSLQNYTLKRQLILKEDKPLSSQSKRSLNN